MVTAVRHSAMPGEGSADECGSLAELIEQVRAGSQEAAQTMYDRYQTRLVRLIRRRYLPRGDRLRQIMDSTDIAQEAWKSMFETIARGESPAPEHFVHFLLTVTKNCSLMAIRAHITAHKRSQGSMEPFESACANVTGHEGDPAELAAAQEEWMLFLADLQPAYREIMVRSLSGEPLATVARKLGLKFKTVKHIVVLVGERWDLRGGGRSRIGREVREHAEFSLKIVGGIGPGRARAYALWNTRRRNRNHSEVIPSALARIQDHPVLPHQDQFAQR